MVAGNTWAQLAIWCLMVSLIARSVSVSAIAREREREILFLSAMSIINDITPN